MQSLRYLVVQTAERSNKLLDRQLREVFYLFREVQTAIKVSKSRQNSRNSFQEYRFLPVPRPVLSFQRRD